MVQTLDKSQLKRAVPGSRRVFISGKELRTWRAKIASNGANQHWVAQATGLSDASISALFVSGTCTQPVYEKVKACLDNLTLI